MKRLLLLVNLIFLSIPGMLYAADRGMCGDNIAWLYNDGVLTISGSGEMYSYSSSSPRPYDIYKSNIKRVILSGNIELIGCYAFDGYDAVEEIEFNEGLKRIGYAAFKGCSSLKELNLPNSLEIITYFPKDKTSEGAYFFDLRSDEAWFCDNYYNDYGYRGKPFEFSEFRGAFCNCSSLESITLGENLIRIGYSSFAGCLNLKTINWNAINCTIPRAVITIRSGAQIPDYDPYTFAGCPIETLNLGEKVTSIPRKGFIDIKTLKFVNTKGNIQRVEAYAFDGTAWLSGQKDRVGLITLDKVIYSYNPEPISGGGKTALSIPEGITCIAPFAFSEYVVQAEKRACNIITDITMPKSLQFVGYGAFNGFDNGNGTFRLNSGQIKRFSGPTFEGLYVDKFGYGACISDLKSVNEVIFNDEISQISSYIISGDINIIILPNSLVSIGNNGLPSNVTLREMPSAIKRLGNYALAGIKIPDFVLPSATEYIGKGAIKVKCDRLQTNEIVKSAAPISIASDYATLTDLVWNAVDIIPSEGFEYVKVDKPLNERADKLNVTFGEKVKVIPPYLLSNLNGTISIAGGKNIETISEKAFYNSNSLKAYEMPDNLKAIGDSAFAKSGLESIFIPASVTSMDEDAFADCPLDKAIVACPASPAESAKMGFYKVDLIAPKVYVPDVEAYKDWQPAPLPMLKAGEYYMKDDLSGAVKLECNIPGYEATTDYRLESTLPGEYTVTIPVSFKGERDFTTDVKYSYKITDLSSIDDVVDVSPTVAIENGALVITGNPSSVKVYNPAGALVHEGIAERIALPSGAYIVVVDGKPVKISL